MLTQEAVVRGGRLVAMSSKKQSVEEMYTLGLEYEQLADAKQALRAFKEAAEQAPNNTVYMDAAGRACESMGRMVQATEWYMRAAQVQTSSVDGAPSAADKLLDQVVEAAWVHNLKPNQLDHHQASTAVQHLQYLISNFGPDPTAYRKLAMLLGRIGRIGDTAQLFDHARKAELRGRRWR